MNDRYSDRLKEAIKAGMVFIGQREGVTTARIQAPPNHESLTGEDWIAVLKAASAMIAELESLGIEVIA